jgi:hypothetical protein
MNNIFDDNICWIIMIILITLLIIIYGGPKKYDYPVEYDKHNFSYIENLFLFEKLFENYSIQNNDNYEDITQKYQNHNQIVPNLLNLYYVSLKPNTHFIFNKIMNCTPIMIIYNHNNIDTDITNDADLKLLIRQTNECDKVNKVNKVNNLNESNKIISQCNNYGYFYTLTNKISVVNIFPIYNDSDKIINFTLYIIKKPFWFY